MADSPVIFDERAARWYDAWVAPAFDPSVLGPTVEFLTGLCGSGSALEFAIGTGRVALPLAARGVHVKGLEISAPMVGRMREKPGGVDIDVKIGHMAEDRVEGEFRVVYLVFNTITNLTTQSEQVACFANASAHLEAGGCFVVEVEVPALRSLPPGTRVRAFDVSPSHVGFDEYIDLTQQLMRSHHYWVADGQAETFSSLHRFVWPSELDLMARLAGLTLAERWEDWGRSKFTGESSKHVSVWTKSGSG